MQSVKAKLKANRKIFYWALPIVFVVCLVAGVSTPKQYKSQMVLVIEDQLAIEQNRVYTHHHPENYDLAVMRTDHAIAGPSYEHVMRDQQLLLSFMKDSVSTLDGKWKGTIKEYLTTQQRMPFWQKPIAKLNGFVSGLLASSDEKKEMEDAHQVHVVSKQDAMTAEMLENMMTCYLNHETGLVTLEVTAQDNFVAMQMVKLAYLHLNEKIRAYQFEKMEIALHQLEQVRDDAAAAYKCAAAAGSPETARLESIYRSFERQVVVYKAQMMYHPALMIAQESGISYKNENSSPFVSACFYTLLLGMLIGLIICRKELMAWF